MSPLPLIGVYPPLAPASALRPARPSFPFDQSQVVLTHLGRGAVWLALRGLGLGPGSTLAMPAYHCGSEVEAARLAGVTMRFYRVDSSLRVDENDLAEAAADADAVYLISHFGFPMPAPPPDKLVIEDAAHGLFSAVGDVPLGSRGQAAIFCPRKSLGVPDGGALLLRDGDAGIEARARPSGQARALAALGVGRAAISGAAPLRRAGTAALRRFSRADAATREGTLTETVIGEWDLAVADMESAAGRPARVTETLLSRVDVEALQSARRRNYERLRDELDDLCPEPFRELGRGTTPLYFPVLAPDRDEALRRLLGGGVRGIEVWPVPHPLLDRERFAELEPVRRGLVGLPVHQGLEPWHMDVVVDAARKALRR